MKTITMVAPKRPQAMPGLLLIISRIGRIYFTVYLLLFTVYRLPAVHRLPLLFTGCLLFTVYRLFTVFRLPAAYRLLFTGCLLFTVYRLLTVYRSPRPLSLLNHSGTGLSSIGTRA
jgi:hypothetical protein